MIDKCSQPLIDMTVKHLCSRKGWEYRCVSWKQFTTGFSLQIPLPDQCPE